MQTVVGLTGEHQWLRRRVWFWQRKAYEVSGWRKSPSEGSIRPMMVKRTRLIGEGENASFRLPIDGQAKSP